MAPTDQIMNDPRADQEGRHVGTHLLSATNNGQTIATHTHTAPRQNGNLFNMTNNPTGCAGCDAHISNTTFCCIKPWKWPINIDCRPTLSRSDSKCTTAITKPTLHTETAGINNSLVMKERSSSIQWCWLKCYLNDWYHLYLLIKK